MNHPKLTILGFMGRKLSVIILLAISAAGAYATLGDGKKKGSASTKTFLSNRTITPGNFSLKSGYTYRGSQVISSDKRYFNINTLVTLQKGHNTYILPLKKKVLLSNVKIELGNRQFKRN